MVIIKILIVVMFLLMVHAAIDLYYEYEPHIFLLDLFRIMVDVIIYLLSGFMLAYIILFY